MENHGKTLFVIHFKLLYHVISMENHGKTLFVIHFKLLYHVISMENHGKTLFVIHFKLLYHVISMENHGKSLFVIHFKLLYQHISIINCQRVSHSWPSWFTIRRPVQHGGAWILWNCQHPTSAFIFSLSGATKNLPWDEHAWNMRGSSKCDLDIREIWINLEQGEWLLDQYGHRHIE